MNDVSDTVNHRAVTVWTHGAVFKSLQSGVVGIDRRFRGAHPSSVGTSEPLVSPGEQYFSCPDTGIVGSNSDPPPGPVLPCFRPSYLKIGRRGSFHLRDVDEFEHRTRRGVEREPRVEDERAVVPRGEALGLVHGVARHDEHAALPGEALDQRDAASHREGASDGVSGRQVGPRPPLGEGQDPVQLAFLQPTEQRQTGSYVGGGGGGVVAVGGGGGGLT